MEKTPEEEEQFRLVNLQKSAILKQLRQKGCRITRQRELLIDVILQKNCSCCKEIYYYAIKKDQNIGMATIYRIMNILEEIGALEWKNGYRICYREYMPLGEFMIEMDDSSLVKLDSKSLNQVLEKGMSACGYLDGKKVKQIMIKNKESHT
ncbi:MAG: transcriptional repressor [Eubacteriales bacterium]|nr:transcriptional repressor [Eubacteriales bacterium]